MPGKVTFLVNFTGPKEYFYPGETMVGDIFVFVSEGSIKCKQISVKFKGKSHVEWTTGSGDNRKTHSQTELYFNDSATLLKPLPQEKEIILNPGEHPFPFQFKLPSDLPPSVVVKYGYVVYTMKITIANSWLKSDIETKIPFKVVASPLGLGQTGGLLEPVTATKEKFLCCLCCESGPIRIKGSLQKQVFSLGEPIVFSFEVDNRETDEYLRKIEARLMQMVTVISKGGTSREREYQMAAVQISQGVPAGTENSWHNKTLDIPANIVPTFNNCQCIQVNYYFIINVDISSAFDPNVLFPVVISSGAQLSQPQTSQPHPSPCVAGMPEPMTMPSPARYQQPSGYSASVIHLQSSGNAASADYQQRSGYPTANYLQSSGYPAPTTGHPSHPPPTITQQPVSWDPTTPPPPYPGMEGTK